MKRKVRFIDFNGIKMSPRFCEAAYWDAGILIGFDDKVPYMPEYPWLFDADGPVAPLHICVWDFFMAATRPRKKGDLVHHQDGNKLNATIENLSIGSREVHSKAHALRRQKFSPRKKWQLWGWYRPRDEKPVETLPFSEEMQYREELLSRERALSEERKLFREKLSQLRNTTATASAPQAAAPSLSPPIAHPPETPEAVLGKMLPALRREMDHLDSGKKVPPPKSRPRPRDRILCIGRIRRGCTPGEAALVRLLVKNGFDLGHVAKESGVPGEVLREMLRSTAVDLAIGHWRRYQRLPPPCSPKKLKPYA